MMHHCIDQKRAIAHRMIERSNANSLIGKLRVKNSLSILVFLLLWYNLAKVFCPWSLPGGVITFWILAASVESPAAPGFFLHQFPITFWAGNPDFIENGFYIPTLWIAGAGQEFAVAALF